MSMINDSVPSPDYPKISLVWVGTGLNGKTRAIFNCCQNKKEGLHGIQGPRRNSQSFKLRKGRHIE